MAAYIGLNLKFLLNDIYDRNRALLNIGLNREDLLRISGLNNALLGGDTSPSQDMRALTNLDLDQEKELYALRISGESIQNNVMGIKDVGQPLEIDIIQSGKKLAASAIKYNYLTRTNNNTNIEITQADISTSRVSSWSSADSPVTLESPIFYGGDVKVNSENVIYSGRLRVVDKPEKIRYEAETPTHTVAININGQPKKFLAMKGIPLQFEGFFRNADLHVSLSAPIQNAANQNISPVWRIVNLDASNKEYENTSPPQGFNSPWRYRDVQNRPRLVELYYNPSRISELKLRSLNLSDWPLVPLPSLKKLDIMFNDFYRLPDLKFIAPSLEELYLQGNNMSEERGGLTANYQLNQFAPTTLKLLNMNGVFQDSEEIDLSTFNNLEALYFNSYFKSRSSRAMLGSGNTTPLVWSDANGSTKIKVYQIIYQKSYSRIPHVINESNSLEYLMLWYTDVRGVGPENNFITLPNADNLTHFRSYNCYHNFVDMSEKEKLYWYEHIWAGLRSTGGDGEVEGQYLNGKIRNCPKLAYFIPRGVNLYIREEDQPLREFRTLESLYYVDLRWTQMAGYFDNLSFEGSPSLRYLYIRHGRWGVGQGEDYVLFDESQGDVFGDNCPNFYYLRILFNRNIRGSLPNLSKNKNLRIVVVIGTSMSGQIPNYNNNRNLGYLYLYDNSFSGNVPNFNGAHYRYIHIYNNNLNGNIPELSCPGLIEFFVYNNQLNGTIPTFAGCTSLRRIKLHNNALNQLPRGAFAANIYLTELDLSNNLLNTTDAENLIIDLIANYTARPRGGVIVNLQGNSGINVAALKQNSVNQENLNILSSAGWAISF
jgi:hypothetical protein